MKKMILFIFILLALIVAKVVEASTWYYKWENTYINVPINSSIYEYTNLPKATLYKDGKSLIDASITYNCNGDWLYYLKDVDTNKTGEYMVWYKASESKYKPGTCNNYKQLVTFRVYDDVPPQINLLQKEIKIPINSKEIKIEEGNQFNIKDNLNDYKVSIDLNEINLNKIGQYKAKIYVVDKAGNQDTAEIEINVIDNEGPVVNLIEETNTIIIEKGKNINWRDYLSAFDAVDGDVFNSLIIDKNLKIDVIGEYPRVKFSFYDKENNEGFIYLNIKVVDTIAPILELSVSQIELEYLLDFSNYEFKRYIKTATDNGEDMLENVIIDISNLRNEVGNYEIFYSLTDIDGNSVTKSLIVNVISSTKPIINTNDVVILIGEALDFTKYIEVIDPSDPFVKDTLVIDKSNYDNQKAGIYYLNVSCHNSSGLYTNAILKVEVKESKEDSFTLTINNILILVIAVIAAVIYCLYLYLKKRKESKITI